MGNKTRVKDTSIGAILGLGLAVPYFFTQGLFEPRPYNNVTVDDLSYVDGNRSVGVQATFVKTEECTFQDLKVFGEYLGVWVPLTWSDPKGEEGDRYTGYNTLHILVDVEGVYYSTIEVRTRHSCDGKKVDEIFLSRAPDGYISS